MIQISLLIWGFDSEQENKSHYRDAIPLTPQESYHSTNTMIFVQFVSFPYLSVFRLQPRQGRVSSNFVLFPPPM